MAKTARLIITFDCPRACEYCCNKYSQVMASAIKIADCHSLKDYKEVCVTGGEPMLYPEHTLDVVSHLRAVTKAKIYLYTAWWPDEPGLLPAAVDGIQYSLHTGPNMEADVTTAARFEKAQQAIGELSYRKSCRLYIDPTFRAPVTVVPMLWNRILISPWKPEDQILAERARGIPDEQIYILDGFY